MTKRAQDKWLPDGFVDEICDTVARQTGKNLRHAVNTMLNRKPGDRYNDDYYNGLLLAEAVETPGVDRATLLRIAEYANYSVTYAFRRLNGNGNRFDDDIAEALMSSKDENSRHTLILTNSVSEAIVAKFYPVEKSAHVRSAMLPYINDPAVVSKAVKDKSVGVRTSATRHRLLTREDALTLARDKNKTVVISLSRDTQDPIVQKEIIKSPHPNSGYYLATNKNLDGDVVRELAAVCDANASRVLLRNYGEKHPEIVNVIMDRTDTKEYRVIEAAVAVPALGLERRAEIAVGSRSVRVRRWFFDSLTLDELQSLVGSGDKKVQEFASKQLVKKAFF